MALKGLQPREMSSVQSSSKNSRVKKRAAIFCTAVVALATVVGLANDAFSLRERFGTPRPALQHLRVNGVDDILLVAPNSIAERVVVARIQGQELPVVLERTAGEDQVTLRIKRPSTYLWKIGDETIDLADDAGSSVMSCSITFVWDINPSDLESWIKWAPFIRLIGNGVSIGHDRIALRPTSVTPDNGHGLDLPAFTDTFTQNFSITIEKEHESLNGGTFQIAHVGGITFQENDGQVGVATSKLGPNWFGNSSYPSETSQRAARKVQLPSATGRVTTTLVFSANEHTYYYDTPFRREVYRQPLKFDIEDLKGWVFGVRSFGSHYSVFRILVEPVPQEPPSRHFGSVDSDSKSPP